VAPREAREPDEAERAAWRRAWPEQIALLGEHCAADLAALERRCGAPPDELAARPAPGRWSPLDVLEHVALADRYLLQLAEKLAAKAARRAARGEPWPVRAPDLEALERVETDGAPWRSPAHMFPTGRVAPADVAHAITSQRAGIAALLARLPSGEGTLADARMSHLGPAARLDCYGVLEFLRRHARRHARALEGLSGRRR
jgi:hypothetical protein